MGLDRLAVIKWQNVIFWNIFLKVGMAGIVDELDELSERSQIGPHNGSDLNNGKDGFTMN